MTTEEFLHEFDLLRGLALEAGLQLERGEALTAIAAFEALVRRIDEARARAAAQERSR
jgi:hypothetical protein